MTDNQLVRFDTNALNRALLGFDSLFSDFENRLGTQINTTYPPYNVLKYDEDSYSLEVAVTGFAPEEVSAELDQNQLVIKAMRIDAAAEETKYLHRGLAARNFTRSWTLAEHMEVGEVCVKNGVLTIELNRKVPEALKPRQLKILAK